jgi:cell shape-determining protein MreC
MSKKTERVKRQIKLWMIVASIMPSTALCFIFLCYFLDMNAVIGFAIIVGGTVMFLIATIWWWWALLTLKTLTNHRHRNLQLFERLFLIRNKKIKSLEKELQELKKLLKDT